MSFELFKGSGSMAPQQPVALPAIDRASQRDPANYLADAGLANAVNVSLWLGVPLLITGEPGTGKTELAYRVAWELGLGKPLVFDTKSGSVAQDLFYAFDTVGRFGAAQLRAVSPEAKDLDPRRYVRYQALGLAIIHANPPEHIARWLPSDFPAYAPQRSVVLVDEIDKAPRDFPNDLLAEINSMRFRVPEISDALVQAPEAMRPVVVITSNSEKQLPDAFLRRCIYYHIEFPDHERLKDIVAQRLPRLDAGAVLVEDAINFFFELRKDGAGLTKKPSTAELLNFLDALSGIGVDLKQPLRGQQDKAGACLRTLAKTQDDIPLASEALKAWCKG